jgi:hypothetical protein
MIWLWIIFAMVIIAGSAVAIYYIVKEDNNSVNLDKWLAIAPEGGGGTISALSEDGKTWSTGSFTSSVGLINISYGFKDDKTTPLWVLTAPPGTSDSNIFYSEDGITAVSADGVSFAGTAAFDSAYGLSSDKTTPIWVAVGNEGTNNTGGILYSKTGTSWETVTFSGTSFSRGNNVAYGLSSDQNTSRWVAVGTPKAADQAKLLYSDDGISWNVTNGASFGQNAIGSIYPGGTAVAYGLSSDNTPKWVATGDNNGGTAKEIICSSDGVTWEEATGFTVPGTKTVAYGKDNNNQGIWVVASAQGGVSLNYSRDGKTWTDTDVVYPADTTNATITISYANNMFVAVGQVTDPFKDVAFAYSFNGISWVKGTNNTIYRIWYAAAYPELNPAITW